MFPGKTEPRPWEPLPANERSHRALELDKEFPAVSVRSPRSQMDPRNCYTMHFPQSHAILNQSFLLSAISYVETGGKCVLSTTK